MELPSLEELGAVGNFNTKEILDFYNNVVYPKLDTFYENTNNQINSYLDGIISNKQFLIESNNNIKKKIQDIKLMKSPNDIIRELDSIIDITNVMYDIIFISLQHNINDHLDILIELKREIISFFEERNYVYDYFLISKDSYMYNINVNDTKIRFDIAYSGYCTPNSDELAEKVFNRLKSSIDNGYSMLGFSYSVLRSIYPKLREQVISGGYEHIGWSRDELITALKQSEYFEEEVEELEENVVRKYLYTYPKLNGKYRVKYKRDLPIFEHLTKFELELIYRYINNNNSINLRALCKSDYVDEITFYRMLDKFDPIFMNGNYRGLSVQEICNLLGASAIESTMLEIPQASLDIIYQPGGRYSENVKSKYQEYMGIKSDDKSEIINVYRKYIDNCSNPMIPLHSILFDAIELGIIDKIDRNMTREQICSIVSNYINNLYKK